jgi:hypothetical protein
MSLTVLYHYHQDEWYLYSITVITYVSDCTVSVSPRWVIPVLVYMPLWHQLMNQKPLFSISENYSQHCQTTLSWSKYYSLVSIGVSRSVITVIEYRYHSSWWYWYSTVRDILTVLYQYHQDEWYLYYITVITYVSDCTVSVSPRWVIPVHTDRVQSET